MNRWFDVFQPIGLAMGGSGEAPPVRSTDVLILVGASILTAAFFVHGWQEPILFGTTAEVCEDQEGEWTYAPDNLSGSCKSPSVTLEYNLFGGDEFKLEWKGNFTELVITMDETSINAPEPVENTIVYKAGEGGTYTFEIKFDDEGEAETSVSRAFFLDWLLYPLGGLLLGYGFLLKSRKAKNDDVLEAEIIS